jgi:fructan beta-fructosidase
MSWGHAVSADLLHWRELPVAIPEKDGEMIFTGSVVVDRRTAAAFVVPAMSALLRSIRDIRAPSRHKTLLTASIEGAPGKQYEKNPVLDLHRRDFRDPSVSWNETIRKWVMAVSLPSEHKVRFYASPDLKNWEQLSDFGPASATSGAWECPDLLRVPSDGNASKRVWVLKVGLDPGALQGGSGEQYFLGNFDGKTFIQFTDPGAYGWTNYGKDDYCAISFNGLPKERKPILMGWMSNWQYEAKMPTSPWRGQMSLPRQVSFLRDEAGLALKQEPMIDDLRAKAVPVTGSSINLSENSSKNQEPTRSYGDSSLSGNNEMNYTDTAVSMKIWWARRDSNPQPRDYEFPSISISL